ncbi:MAG: hypothetical protein LUQ59_07330 [Methanothrix sp.]|nr:hypothetical protein [Methanothrix sp.]
MLLSNQAGASYWFQVINVTPIEMTPNSEANFTVSVKGLGSERAYVELVFKNITEGLNFTCPKMIKNVYPAGVTKYNCSVKVEDLPEGNYSFVVDVAAHSSPSGKKTAFVNVVTDAGPSKAQPEDETNPSLQANREVEVDENRQPQSSIPADNTTDNPANSPADQDAQESPAPGAAAAILVLMLVMRRMGR